MSCNPSCCSSSSKKKVHQNPEPVTSCILNPESKIFIALSAAKESIFFLFFLFILLSILSTSHALHIIFLSSGIGYGLWRALTTMLKKENFLENLQLNVLLEKEAVRTCYDEKKNELFIIFKNKGIDPSIAKQITECIALDSQTLLKVLLKEKFNIEMDRYLHPAEYGLWLFIGAFFTSLVFSASAFFFSYKVIILTGIGIFVLTSYLKALHTQTVILKAIIWHLAAAFTCLGLFFFLVQALS
ncbi:hypothetical protein CLAVI_000140 [Candidatus Clavichlamydia salmonicola]|uniref:VIT1/CCC1 transporter family protein n=1 Tax=Candidatus Clavichlamydia salmonicola TaxID=469812 RepID=UPI00189164A4|nr:VIT1/CCC1 transporter family protein [Candidatus Clavichlamydia salmonicola]MBF5050530.1 hypothetical protein [Candidatus Clavichlamydia salmonicola]